MATTDLFGTFLDTLAGRRADPCTSPEDPVDRVLAVLADEWRAGRALVPLTAFVPGVVPSVGTLLETLSRMESFGIVGRTAGGYVALTVRGRDLSVSLRP